MSETVRLYIDGVEHRVPKGANLVDAAKMVGNDVPVFCYHPKLAPVGMCRMCLVELGGADFDKEKGDFKRTESGEIAFRWQPRLATACTTFVTDGMAIRTTTDQVQTARDDIIEFLLTSHPLDCPVCDKGGECPLQNLTMQHGAGESRFVFDEKQHLAKHYPLGDLIYLDRERCIQCARCTRFQEELVGDAVLAFHERGRRLQIVTTSTPAFDTYFSGNTTDICPVGALTTADFRFGARPWELTEVPSICPHCAVGCNTSASTRLDREAGGKTIVKRIMPRQNEGVNEIWICDKGRFGHHHSRHAERLTKPLIRQGGKLIPTTWEKALSAIAERLAAADGNVGAIAGATLSNEDLWELRGLVEGVGGTQLGVYPYRMTGAEIVCKVGLGVGSNFKDMGKGTTILVIASDLSEEAPVWYLRVKTAGDRGAQIITVNARPTELDRFAKKQIRYSYGGEIAAVKALLDESAIKEATNLVILVGGEGLDRAGHAGVMQAAGNVLLSTGHVGKANNGLLAVWAGANTQGAFDLGYSSEATEALLSNPPSVLFLADADILGEDAAHAGFLSGAEGAFTVVSELFLTKTAAAADVVLPRQSFAERDGTFTNGERRVQRFYTAQPALDGTRPDWKVFAEISKLRHGAKPKLSTAAVMKAISEALPLYAGMTYGKLGEVTKQYPDVGGENLYYGGTAYENTGGLGVQWQTDADKGEKISIAMPAVGKLTKLKDGETLIVPVTELYDRKPTFAASSALMHSHIPAPYIVINKATAEALGVTEGESLSLSCGSVTGEYAVRVDDATPKQVAYVARHLNPNTPAPATPMVGALRKVEVAQPA
ncbi:MAG TPA: NADH-quinone oxidoreductase subunit NuoG [Aggregatilineales bacterium]|nr:NADH-quinone oxidoreductase subunit NuoG [Anaerolineales bacterium]HRE47503.1 NADH-quinone oxidoreductase subunit NuoG [Aggregatilineales bacterium]